MERDSQWSIRLDESVLVVEFPHGTVLTPEDAEALADRWRTVTTEAAVEAAVVVVRTTRSCSDAGRGALREAARTGADRGVTRWAVVAERPKRRYLKRTVDVAGVEVESFNDDAAALAWAGGRSTGTA
ncbi:hypothetical protein GRS48_03080 [Halorubrum sp. JWXQ-INN 858]|uniref:hypothetical protein n=1 Tax=Halorubrum sp. JWXQ-INN 858 TaxID=2690782 RepID=UPI001359207D|nr:hypothetical protein [Halorubrum sp. JWXQ-INN 858]MWV63811.1 hypothetical protein [Halorubrum sp. JWXQ-INN 858]